MPKSIRKVKIVRKKKPSAKRAMRMVRSLKREVEGDKKFVDERIAQSVVSNTATVVAISQPYVAPDSSSGSFNATYTTSFYYIIKSIQARLFVKSPFPVTPPYDNQIVRVIIFQDKEVATSAVTPTAADLLQTPTDVNSPLNLLNCKRFKVHFDRQIGVGESPSIRNLKLYKKCSIRAGQFYNANSVTYIPRENQLYILWFSDTSTTLNEPLFSFYTRVRFIDA